MFLQTVDKPPCFEEDLVGFVYSLNVSYTRNDHEIFDDEGNPTDTETQESASIEIDVYFLNKEIPGGWVGK